MKSGLNELAMCAPLEAIASDQSVTEEVVHQPIEEDLVRVLLGGEHYLQILWLQHHKEGKEQNPDAHKGTIEIESIGSTFAHY